MTRNTLDSGLLPTRKNLREAEERLWNELLQITERLPSEEDRVKADFLIWFLKDMFRTGSKK